MANQMSDKLSVREGLIQVVSAERFQTKPRSGGNQHVVVMEKKGNTLRHYSTLRSTQDRLSVGESLWGNYVCYVVDLGSRELRIEEEFPTHDRITNVRVVTDVAYHALDGERVAIGVEDALQTLREEVVTILKREIARLRIEQVDEERLEARLYQEGNRLQGWLGIAIERTRVRVDWDEEILAQIRKERDEEVADAQRRREWKRQDEERRREERLEREDIQHIDQIIQQLGLDELPADLRLRLHALPRQEALNQVVAAIEEQRVSTREFMMRRMEEEYSLIRTMIESGVLEEMDLADFGKSLLERYQHSMASQEMLGMPPSALFGKAQRPAALEGKSDQDAPSAQLAGADDTTGGSNESTETGEEAASDPIDDTT